MKKILAPALFLSLRAFSQDWVNMMCTPGHNFYEIQAAFNAYWKDHDITEKSRGYKQFKRWEYFMEPRVYPSGDLSLVSNNWKNFLEFRDANIGAKSLQSSAAWVPLGPFGSMNGTLGGLPRNAGRDNFITFDPSSPTSYWAGTPAGGLWSTTNDGGTWNTATDFLTVVGCSDLVIDPTNSSVMYLATGDADGDDTYSIGVLKSTDGGATWNTTGLTYQVSQQAKIRRLLIDPSNPQVVLAATSGGIMRTTNGGTNWSQVHATAAFDMEFKPGDPTTIYASSTAFYKSTNNGASFSIVSGIPLNAVNRVEIAVTPADPQYVYLVAALSSNSGLQGVYRSVNSGATFSLMMNSPNILGNACNGTSTGGQSWYDLSIAASPLNQDEVAVGGVNVWRSLNGGSSFSCLGCWNSVSNPPYVHADIHDLEYNSAGALYAACDGGIFAATTNSWVNKTGTRNIAEIYKIGLSSLSPNKWITGHQDNGTNVFTGSSYNVAIGGDGMDCFVDRTNDNNMFGSLYYGDFRRSGNGGVNWSVITSGMNDNAPWVSPWKQDPQVSTRIYAGRSYMWVSNNLGSTWTQIANTPGSGDIVEFAIAPSNNQYIYIIHGTGVYRTTDAGATWASIGSGLPLSLKATFITVHPNDPKILWVTFSSYSAASKVFMSTNAGASWTNITGNLPNLPANCSVFQPGSTGLIYVGMDVGVYYRDVNSTSWTLYNTALPNCPVRDMEISPAAPTKLRAATYGRGVWEVDVAQASNAPLSSFSFSGLKCAGTQLTFTDQSIGSPTSWSWSVTPSTGVNISSAAAQNPTISFASAGTYTISMKSTNGAGPGSTATQTIAIAPLPVLAFGSTPTLVCMGDPLTVSATGAAAYTWDPGSITTPQFSFVVSNSVSYTVTGTNSQGCVSTSVLDIVADPCAGINKAFVSGSVRLFPNPARSSVLVRATDESFSISAIECADASGRIVHSERLSGRSRAEVSVDISAWPAGIYMVTVRGENGRSTELRLVKE